MEIDKKTIGTRIRLQRKSLHLTQEVVSEQIGISKNHLSSIECGKSLPTTKIVFKLCDVLGATPDYYLIGTITKEVAPILSEVRKLPDAEQRRFTRIVNAFLESYYENLEKTD